MPSKLLLAGVAFVLLGAASFPVNAQMSEPEGTQPETAAPAETPRSTTQNEVAGPEATASDSDAGPSHRLTGAAVLFNLIDDDADGAIDLQEASALFEAIFKTMDADGDGKLSKSEINSALRRMHGGYGGRGYYHHQGDGDHRDHDDGYQKEEDR